MEIARDERVELRKRVLDVEDLFVYRQNLDRRVEGELRLIDLVPGSVNAKRDLASGKRRPVGGLDVSVFGRKGLYVKFSGQAVGRESSGTYSNGPLAQAKR